MAMNDENKAGAAAVWMLMPTVGGVLGFTAIGWYPWLACSAVTGLITWDMLSEWRSRKTFLGCLGGAAIAGISSHWIFRLPDGSVSGRGIMLIVLPALVALSFFAMKIHAIETGEDD
ncbi:hypothetical protein LYSHEL_27140 [Lysobacter helvus]|uniref:SPW repeat-containing protein n=3 Tax=Lysobacterales TaxID=135614 RepID=A0ABN6FVF2_9GAMM|nr:hypothetical protein LYSCAS_27110 [Lysobacter caseinilyticus]BCT96843.1 hypothetical protein LYSHEL_27140 [Lysobacter helvus]